MDYLLVDFESLLRQLAYRVVHSAKSGDPVADKDIDRFIGGWDISAGVKLGDQKMMLDLNGSIASEARYRGLLEAAPDAMVVVNQGGGIVLLNVQAEKQFGYRRDELVGQKVTESFPKALRNG